MSEKGIITLKIIGSTIAVFAVATVLVVICLKVFFPLPFNGRDDDEKLEA
jgi:hypothetical protein